MNRDVIHELVEHLPLDLLDEAVVILQALMDAGSDSESDADADPSAEQPVHAGRRGRRLRDEAADEAQWVLRNGGLADDDDDFDAEAFINSPEYRPTTLDWSMRGQAPRAGRVAGRLRRGRMRLAVEQANDKVDAPAA